MKSYIDLQTENDTDPDVPEISDAACCFNCVYIKHIESCCFEAPDCKKYNIKTSNELVCDDFYPRLIE